PSSSIAGNDIQFSETTTGGVTSWSWIFGDGTASSAQNPLKRFATGGSYTVTRTAYRNSESSMTSKVVNVASNIPATPPPAATQRTLISASAQTNGIGGSVWRTELTLFNAGDATSIDLIFVPGNSGSMLTRTIFLGAKQSVTYANALLDIFGLSSGAGAIAIEATNTSSTPDIRTSSRTFTNGAFGTYGQAVPDVTTPDLDATTYLTALAANASYRTNIGLV